VADGDEALALAVVEPTWTDFHVAYRVGARHPLSQGAAGKAIGLLDVVEPTWTDFHVAYRVGARHPLERGAAGRAILLGREIRSGGAPGSAYVQTMGELQAGARGLASPVLDVDGLDASVGIVTLNELDEHEVGPKVTAAACEVSRRLT
jgi:DNA-binding IclR family transcriptional regulator